MNNSIYQQRLLQRSLALIKSFQSHGTTQLLITENDGIVVATGRVSDYPNPIKYTVTIVPSTLTSSFSNITTQNSMVHYNTAINKKYVWFRISKDNKTEHQFDRTINGGLVQHNLYLHFGAGTYSVTILTADQEDGLYYEYAHFQIL